MRKFSVFVVGLTLLCTPTSAMNVTLIGTFLPGSTDPDNYWGQGTDLAGQSFSAELFYHETTANSSVNIVHEGEDDDFDVLGSLSFAGEGTADVTVGSTQKVFQGSGERSEYWDYQYYGSLPTEYEAFGAFDGSFFVSVSGNVVGFFPESFEEKFDLTDLDYRYAGFYGVEGSMQFGSSYADLDVTEIQFNNPVPEPGAWALLLAGLSLLGITLRRTAMRMRSPALLD